MILLTGATGNNGGEIARQLAARGVPFRALVRDKTKAGDLAALPGAQIVEGDFEKPDTLDAALTNIDTAFLLSSPDPRSADLQGNFLDAAVRASSVKHVVKFSALGASPDSPVRLHGQTEEKLKASGLNWTILRPNNFMQGMLPFAPLIKEHNALFDPLGEAGVSYVDVGDIALVAVAALTNPAAHAGKSYDITGPDALTGAQVTAALSKATGRPIQYQAIALDVFKQGALERGVPAWQADGLGELYDALARGFGAVITTVVADVAKKAPLSFSQFARDNAAAFSN